MNITDNNGLKSIDTMRSSDTDKKTKKCSTSDILSQSAFFFLTNGFIVLTYGYSLCLLLISIYENGDCLANNSFVPMFSDLNKELVLKGYKF